MPINGAPFVEREMSCLVFVQGNGVCILTMPGHLEAVFFDLNGR